MYHDPGTRALENKPTPALHGFLAHDNAVIIRSATCTETWGKIDYADLHKAMLRMYIKPV